MSNSHSQQARNTARVRSLFGAVLLLACAVTTVTHAAAQTVTPPVEAGDAAHRHLLPVTTPDAITPLPGNAAFLVAHAFGSQGYTCLPASNGGTAWSTSARPEATLFVKVFGELVQIITHFTSIDANPNEFAPNPVPLGGSVTWQSSFDTSKVWAQKVGSIDAGSDASCPNKGAIPCLLLQSIGNQEGPTGGKLLAKATFVQRLNTKGGAAPTTACTVGQTQLQGYEADYVFFHGNE